MTSCCASSQSSTKIYLSSFPRSAFLSVLHPHVPSLTHTCISPIPRPQFLSYSFCGPQSLVQLINLISHSPYLTYIFSSIPSPILLPMSGTEQHSLLSLQVLESQGKEGEKGNDVLSIFYFLISSLSSEIAKGSSREENGRRGNGFVAHSGLSGTGLGKAQDGSGDVRGEMTSWTVWVGASVEPGLAPSSVGM